MLKGSTIIILTFSLFSIITAEFLYSTSYQLPTDRRPGFEKFSPEPPTIFGLDTILFESFTDTTFPPVGWTRYNFNAGNQWTRYTTYFNSTPACARCSADAPNNDWLITPQIGPLKVNDSLIFYYRAHTTTATETLRVRVSTSSDVSDTSQYSEISLISTATTTWTRRALSLSAFAGNQVFIAFYYSANNKRGIAIDDIFLKRPVIDVGCIRITAPTGTIDSGTAVTPACTVQNFGNVTSSYTVRMKIGAFYNQTASVTNHTPGAKLRITFPSWTALERGDLSVSCSTELMGDTVPTNDKVTGSVTVRVRDVGSVFIVAPTGTIDSATVVTPACTVQNFGTTTETYTVRLKIGAFYNQTATVTNHTPGIKFYITFPTWTAVQKGTHIVSCSTGLAGDIVPTNNKQIDSVKVRVRNVGVVAIVAPTGTIDSGAVVTPVCTVQNFGTTAETYTVRLKIGDFYNDTATVLNHIPGTKVRVTLPNWTVNQKGLHTVTCSTELTNDIVPANDKRTGSVTVRFHDVGVIRITAPTGTIDSGTVVTPACTVQNFGTYTETYTVRMKIGDFYNVNASVIGHTPGTKIRVTFPSWTAVQKWTHPVVCSTELIGDDQPANDKKTDSVIVRFRIRNVGTIVIVAPKGTIDSGTVITPACTVQNFGTHAETYTVQMKIGTFYNRTASVTSHTPGTKIRVTFPSWTAVQRGVHVVTCSTQLAGDTLLANDRRIDTVRVRLRDVSVITLVAPVGRVDSGTVITPACTVQNLGTTTETYTVRMKIGTFFNEAVVIINHLPGTKAYLTFSTWTATQKGKFPVSCSTELPGDERAINNKRTDTVTVKISDVGVITLLAPIGVVDSGAVITPACSVQNFGSVAETYPVRMKIGNFYDTSVTVSNHTAGAKLRITFPTWTVRQKGTHTVICSTALVSDFRPTNDKKTDSVIVTVRDVGVIALLGPTGTIDSGTVITPACTVYNFGITTETYPVRMRIGAFYNQTATITDHTPGTKVYVTFPTWTANQRGAHVAKCSTALTGDANPTNNSITGSVAVRVRDIGVLRILAPIGTINQGSVVIPKALVQNFGTTTETLLVRFRIAPAYLNEVLISLPPGRIDTARFAQWTASTPGTFATQCTTMLVGDMRPTNDVIRDSVKVMAVGMTEEPTFWLTQPKVFALNNNSPNPFISQTVIRYALPKECLINLLVYNANGGLVRTLKAGMEKAGYYRVIWDGRDAQGEEVPKGVYFYRLETSEFKATKKMVKLK